MLEAIRALALGLKLALALALAAGALGLAGARAEEPARVQIGAYINDIQALDLRTHSYVIDIYVWFRWTDPALDPLAETFEFMNMFDPEGHVQEVTYEEPVDQPDGARYQVIRRQGAFSTKFDVRRYPFDDQVLRVAIEDTERTANGLVFVPDEVTINPDLRLPGYAIGEPRIVVTEKPYPTNFGDLNYPEAEPYSRAAILIPIKRPGLAGAAKTILPVLLIMLCAVAALFLTPRRVEARVGLAITALLTLVALQFSVSGSLPEVDYLLMLDQIYIASYAGILAVLAIIVASERRPLAAAEAPAPPHRGACMAAIVGAGYGLVMAAVLVANLAGGGGG